MFAANVRGRWRIETPATFDKKLLIQVAAQDHQEIADHYPRTMGKNRACYSSLYRVTKLFAELSSR